MTRTEVVAILDIYYTIGYDIVVERSRRPTMMWADIGMSAL